MSMLDRDFIHREIRRMATAMARVGGRRRDGQEEDARRELAALRSEWLGPLADVADRLDEATAVKVLQDVAQVWAYAALTWEKSQLDGNPAAARRALEVGRRALVLHPGLPGAAEELQRWEQALG